MAANDLRACVAAGCDDYPARVRHTVPARVAGRGLLAADTAICVAIAAARFDAGALSG